MRNYISQFVTEYGYPQEARKVVFCAYDILEKNESFASLINNYYKDETIDADMEGGLFYEICKSNAVNFYTGKLVFYICLSKYLKDEYQKAGISEDVYRNSIEDLLCKMMECFDVYGIWGIFASGWFSTVFRLKTFALGRMSYNVGTYSGEDFFVGGREVKNGDMFVSVHIPSSGKPFDRNTRIASYELAYNFYKESFCGKEPLFRCESWLLYPKNKEILSEKSNIISFMDDFKIVGSYEYPDNRYLWRIFGSQYKLPAEKLPRDTSLRRAYADFLAKNNLPGAGVGFFVYDSVNKIILK